MILLIESDRKYPKMSEKLPDIVKAIISHDHSPHIINHCHPYDNKREDSFGKKYGVLKGGETS